MHSLDTTIFGTLKAARDAFEPAYARSVRDYLAAQELQNFASLAKSSESILAETALNAARRAGMFDSVAEFAKHLADPMLTQADHLRKSLTAEQVLLGEALEAKNRSVLHTVGSAKATLAAQLDASASIRKTIEQLVGHQVTDPTLVAVEEAKRIRDFARAKSPVSIYEQLEAEARKRVEETLSGSITLKTLIGAVEDLNRLPIATLRSAGGVASVESLFSSAAMALSPDTESASREDDSALSLNESLAAINQQLNREVQALAKQPMSNEMMLAISVLVNFVVLVLTLLLAPVADFHIKRQLDELYRENAPKKEILNTTRAAIPDRKALAAFRFVHKRPLQIRASASSKALVVGLVPPGAAVYRVEEAGAFTLVEWQQREGESLVRGWAYTRYLERFR